MAEDIVEKEKSGQVCAIRIDCADSKSVKEAFEAVNSLGPVEALVVQLSFVKLVFCHLTSLKMLFTHLHFWITFATQYNYFAVKYAFRVWWSVCWIMYFCETTYDYAIGIGEI